MFELQSFSGVDCCAEVSVGGVEYSWWTGGAPKFRPERRADRDAIFGSCLLPGPVVGSVGNVFSWSKI